LYANRCNSSVSTKTPSQSNKRANFWFFEFPPGPARVVTVVLAFLFLAALKFRTDMPRRWFGCNLFLAVNFPEDEEDEEVADTAKAFAAKEQDILIRVMLVFWCAILYLNTKKIKV